jgi:hypothetical protein
LHPNVAAIRRSPQPNALSRNIAATSSGVRIRSPRSRSSREATSTDSAIACTSSHVEVVQFFVSPSVQFLMSPDTMSWNAIDGRG